MDINDNDKDKDNKDKDSHLKTWCLEISSNRVKSPMFDRSYEKSTFKNLKCFLTIRISGQLSFRKLSFSYARLGLYSRFKIRYFDRQQWWPILSDGRGK